jgi:hypothetical protein
MFELRRLNRKERLIHNRWLQEASTRNREKKPYEDLSEQCRQDLKPILAKIRHHEDQKLLRTAQRYGLLIPNCAHFWREDKALDETLFLRCHCGTAPRHLTPLGRSCIAEQIDKEKTLRFDRIVRWFSKVVLPTLGALAAVAALLVELHKK